MPLTPSSRLGPYDILSPLGAGGFGEVYKARDTRLDRTVAIKILPSADPELKARFEREARAIAALTHPHICTLYDVGHQDGTDYLVMEYLEGETLDKKIARGPIRIDEALKIAVEIAEALDNAHRAGIVHRDLKPANVMLTRGGVKLLDFGLAKLRPMPTGGVAGISTVVTHSAPATAQGTLLGTLQFMSPEQVEGKEADPRSDIWAFGCVVYEMVTGNRAFDGESSASVIAAILERDPSPADRRVPAVLDRVLRQSMAKNPDERWQSAHDLKTELEWIADGGMNATPFRERAHNPWRERAGWIAAAALLVVMALGLLMTSGRRPLAAGVVSRFVVYPPEGTMFTSDDNATVPVPQFALSPDGRALVFAAAAIGARPTLWLRSFEDVLPKRLPGTEDAYQPFWSPNSRWVGFFAEGKLKKISAAGGAVQVVAEGVPNGFGATWETDEKILFAPGNNSAFRVPTSGGLVTALTKLDTSRGEASHRWPLILPDGRHFLFTVRGTEQRGVFAGSLDGATRKFLMRFDSSPVYAPPGYVLWVEGNVLFGQAFDLDRLELSGEAFTVVESVGRATTGQGAVSASTTGTLAYAAALLRKGRLTWFDRAGHVLGSIPGEGDYTDFRLSPDETRLAASLIDPGTNIADIWLIDLERMSRSRFTFGPALNSSPVWSPDGTRLIFRTLERGVLELFQKSAFGGGNQEPVLDRATQRMADQLGANLVPTDWSPDGQNVVYSTPGTATGSDLWLLSLTGHTKPVKLLASASIGIHANFSPDGRFFAYTSNESGRFQVYIQTFPLSDRKWQVSTDGGHEPRWRGDGREIYYLSDDRKLMAVSIGSGPSFDAPKLLFQTNAPASVEAHRTNFVVSRDGRRFLVNTLSADATPSPITLVLNWQAALKK